MFMVGMDGEEFRLRCLMGTWTVWMERDLG